MGLRMASGVPGRGSRKLMGTSAGPSTASSPMSSSRWASVSPMPSRTPQHSSMPGLDDVQAGLAALLPAVGGDDLVEEGPGRLQVVVVAVDPAGRQPSGLTGLENSGRDGHVEPGVVAYQGHHFEDAPQGALDRGRGRPAPGRTRWRPPPRSPWRRRAPRRRRGTASPAPACRSGRTGRRSGSPRDIRRSWPTGCPPPPRLGPAGPDGPHGRGRPAPARRRPAPKPAPSTHRHRGRGRRPAGRWRHGRGEAGGPDGTPPEPNVRARRGGRVLPRNGSW